MDILSALRKVTASIKTWADSKLETKLDKNLGTDNAGKVLTIGDDGNIKSQMLDTGIIVLSGTNDNPINIDEIKVSGTYLIKGVVTTSMDTTSGSDSAKLNKTFIDGFARGELMSIYSLQDGFVNQLMMNPTRPLVRLDSGEGYSDAIDASYVQPVEKTTEMTQPVGIRSDGQLFTEPFNQVQSDWNQNDKKQPDYVKNRTHYTHIVHDSGYRADLMDSTHNIGDIVLLREIPISILDRLFIPGINASYRSEYSFHLVYKVTFYEGSDVYESENDKECISNEEMEISEFSTGNIKVLYNNKREPSIALYIIYDLTTLNDEDKTKFAKTGIYAQLVSLNTYDTATSILVGYRSIKYKKLDSKYLNIPVATNDVAGVVKPVTKTEEMSQDVGVDAEGRLYTLPIASPMTGATAETDGAAGLVPAPKAGEQDKFLRGDGTWSDVPQGGVGGTGNGDMQKTVYDPMGKATDVFAYAENTAESKVSAHNTESGSHSDIRDLITGLTNRLNALADSDDTTLDQLSEIVAYIKSNKSLIDAITTEKVSVSDIIDNLTTNNANKPLSAAQGVALKALIDAISVPDKLPNPNALTFTGAVTGSYDGSEAVTVEIPSGGGGTGNGDMQKTVYDPMGKATDVFAYAENTAESKVSAHNTESGSHSDIRELITGLTNRLNSLADSDDTTLDQLSEIVAYIKSNKSLIDAITTNKVSVSDIVDNLTTDSATKPLSAAQGKALKALIDAITIPDKLPNPNALTFTGAVTGSYDGSSAVTVNVPSDGGGSGAGDFDLILETTIPAGVTVFQNSLPKSMANYRELIFEFKADTTDAKIDLCAGHVTSASGTNRMGAQLKGSSRICSYYMRRISDMALMSNATTGGYNNAALNLYSGFTRMMREIPSTQNFTVLFSIETGNEQYLRVYGVEL